MLNTGDRRLGLGLLTYPRFDPSGPGINVAREKERERETERVVSGMGTVVMWIRISDFGEDRPIGRREAVVLGGDRGVGVDHAFKPSSPRKGGPAWGRRFGGGLTLPAVPLAAAVTGAAAAVSEQLHELEEFFLLLGGEHRPCLGHHAGADELHLHVELRL